MFWKKCLKESFYLGIKMNFKLFYLSEASKEYNIAKVLTDKIIRQLRDMVYSAKSHPDRYKDTKNKWVGLHIIPLKKFLKDMNIVKGGLFDRLKDIDVYLDYGYLDKGSVKPYLTIHGTKKAGGYYEPKGEVGIHLPFINHKTELPFDGYFDEYYSVILHELTHAIQDIKKPFTKGTSDLSQRGWFENDNEREAYLNELYRHLQDYISGTVSALKNYRTTEWGDPDYKEYVRLSNKLKRTFESLENFRKTVRLDSTIIFLDNKTNKDRIDYLSTEHRDVYNKFLEDSYLELKKEFKNVIPTKELKYGEEI